MAQNQEYGDMNFGLQEIWNEILSWGQQHDVVNELSLIIDTCRLLDHTISGPGLGPKQQTKAVLPSDGQRHLKDGVLTLQIPKYAQYHTCKIEVRVNYTSYRIVQPRRLYSTPLRAEQSLSG
jgi:hypothetical protein